MEIALIMKMKHENISICEINHTKVFTNKKICSKMIVKDVTKEKE